MAKEIKATLKLQCPGGQATPAPPVGPALGAHGVPIGDFVKQFNDATRDRMGILIPVVVTIYADRSFALAYKEPPASFLIKKAAGLEKGSGEVGTEIVGELRSSQIRKIAESKQADLNASSVEAAMRIIEGTARSMGVEVKN